MNDGIRQQQSAANDMAAMAAQVANGKRARDEAKAEVEAGKTREMELQKQLVAKDKELEAAKKQIAALSETNQALTIAVKVLKQV